MRFICTEAHGRAHAHHQTRAGLLNDGGSTKFQCFVMPRDRLPAFNVYHYCFVVVVVFAVVAFILVSFFTIFVLKFYCAQ